MTHVDLGRRPCALCDRRFQPKWPEQRFCGPACQQAAKEMRRLRHGVLVPERGPMTPTRWEPQARQLVERLQAFAVGLELDIRRAREGGYRTLSLDFAELRDHVVAAREDTEALIAALPRRAAK